MSRYEKEIMTLRAKLQAAEAENKRLRDGLTRVKDEIEQEEAPLNDTWWYTPTETMLDFIQRTLKEGGEG